MLYVLRGPDGSEHPAPSYVSALQGAIAWSRTVSADIDVYACGPVGYPLLRTVTPTDTLSRVLRSYETIGA